MNRRDAILGALAVAAGRAHLARADEHAPTIFAAASLTEVLQDLVNTRMAGGGPRFRLSFAASSTLARQIEAGAGADVFFSADEEWMNYLAERKLIRAGSRRIIATNELVVVAPSDSTVRLTHAAELALAPGDDLNKAFLAALGTGRLAVADTTTVPAGRYAKAALTKFGLWSQLEAKLASAENVRAALAFVSRGETSLGIVYRTDAQAEPRVRVVGVFPPDSHPPIVYPAALTNDASPEAAQFLDFVGGPEGRAAFARFGFGVPR